MKPTMVELGIRGLTMSNHKAFEVLHVVSQKLEDSDIDEDRSETIIHARRGRRPLERRTITVRGRRRHLPVVLCYQNFYSDNTNSRLLTVYEHTILELFVGQPRVSFEGRCSGRRWVDTIARWLGRGGITGPHPIFERYRFDAHESADLSNFRAPGFGDRIDRLMSTPSARRILFQSETGLTLVLQWRPLAGSPEQVLSLLDAVIDAATTLGLPP